MNRRFLLLQLVFLITLVCGAGCGPVYREPLLQETDFGPLTAKKGYPFAKARALKWRSDAQLDEVIIDIFGDEIADGPHEVSYQFIARGGWGPFRWWDSIIIYVDAREGVVKVTRWLRFDPSQVYDVPLDLESAVWDSSDALQKAEEPSGRAYRAKYANAKVQISAERYIDGQIAWVVDYSRPEAAHTELSIVVDSMTGEVVSRNRF